MSDLDALLTLYATPPTPEPPGPTAARVMAQAERGSFAFEDTEVATYAWGPVDGPVCLMMHGWGSKAADMVAFIRPLARQGWRVIALDAPAHGETAGSGGGETTSMLQMTRLLRAFVPTLGPDGVGLIVGHSLGAAASCYASCPSSPAPGQAIRAGRLALLGLPVSLDTITAKFLGRQDLPEAEHPAFRARVEAAYGIRIPEVSVTRLTEELPRPILLCHDHDDDQAPFAEAEALAASLPEARMVSTSGLGHGGILIAPAVVRAVASFASEASP